MIYVALLLSGLFGGFLAGLFGVGGGIIYVLVLPFALSSIGVPSEQLAQYTIANSLLATIFASLSALVRHYKYDNLHISPSIWLGLSGGVTAILATHYIVESSFFSMDLFNSILIVLLIFMLVDLFFKKERSLEGNANLEKTWKYPPIGIAGGLVSALSGLGGGVAVIPLILKFQGRVFREVASMSMGFIAISAFIVSLYNGISVQGNASLSGSTGSLIWPVTLTLVAGVLIGAQFGVSMGRKISNRNLRLGFALLLLLVIVFKSLEFLQIG